MAFKGTPEMVQPIAGREKGAWLMSRSLRRLEGDHASASTRPAKLQRSKMSSRPPSRKQFLRHSEFVSDHHRGKRRVGPQRRNRARREGVFLQPPCNRAELWFCWSRSDFFIRVRSSTKANVVLEERPCASNQPQGKLMETSSLRHLKPSLPAHAGRVASDITSLREKDAEAFYARITRREYFFPIVGRHRSKQLLARRSLFRTPAAAPLPPLSTLSSRSRKVLKKLRLIGESALAFIATAPDQTTRTRRPRRDQQPAGGRAPGFSTKRWCADPKSHSPSGAEGTFRAASIPTFSCFSSRHLGHTISENVKVMDGIWDAQSRRGRPPGAGARENETRAD